MAVSIGPKLGIDGEKKYRDSINQIIQQAKTLDSEMKLVTSSFDENTDAQEKATRTSEVLNKQIDVQKKRVDALNEMLEKSVALYGEDHTWTLKWKEAVNNANTELVNMQKRLEDTESALTDFNGSLDDGTREMKEIDEAAGDAGGTVGDLAGKLGIDLPDAIGDIDVAGIDTKLLGIAGALAGAAKIVSDAVKDTVEYVENIRSLSAKSGIGEEDLQRWEMAANKYNVPLEKIADVTKDLGKNAYDAANGNEELAKKFEDLGVKTTDSEGNIRPMNDLLWDTLEALSGMEGSTERNAKGVEIMGESFLDIVPMVSEGKEAVIETRDTVSEAADVMSTEMNDAIINIKRQWNEGWEEIGRNIRNIIGDIAIFIDKHDLLAPYKGGLAYDSGMVGRNAGGTDYWRGGWTLVGEEGPELLRLPQGTQIKSNAESAAMMGGVNITVYGAEGQDVEALADEIMYRINDAVARQEAIYR